MTQNTIVRHNKPYTLFTRPGCALCPIAKRWLDACKTNYIEVSLVHKDLIAEFKAAYPNQRTVPFVIDENGEPVLTWMTAKNDTQIT